MNNFIDQLAADLKPVKVQNSPALFTTKLLSTSLFIVAVGLAILTCRNDLREQFFNNLFIVEILSTLGLMGSGLLLIAWVTSPGRNHGPIYKVSTVMTFITLLILNCYRLSLSPIAFYQVTPLKADFTCFFMVLLFSVIISTLLFFVVKKRVVTKPATVGALIGLATVASGTLAITFHCPNASVIHVSLYHFIYPMIAGSFVGALAGKWFLRW